MMNEYIFSTLYPIFFLMPKGLNFYWKIQLWKKKIPTKKTAPTSNLQGAFSTCGFPVMLMLIAHRQHLVF